MTETAAATTKPQGESSADPQGSESAPAPQGTTPAEPQGSTDPPQTPEPQGTDWKAEARKHEQRAKQSADQIKSLREQVKRLVDPEQAEQQVKSVESQLTTITAERDDLAVTNLRLTVALEKGLPASLARRLLGTTRDEIEADADELAQSVTPPAPTVGTPDARAGTRQQQPPKDKNALLRQAVGKA